MNFNDIFFIIIMPVAAVVATAVLVSFFWKGKLAAFNRRYQRSIAEAEERIEMMQGVSAEDDDVSKTRERLLYAWQDDLISMLSPLHASLGEPGVLDNDATPVDLDDEQRKLLDDFEDRLNRLNAAQVRLKPDLIFAAAYYEHRSGNFDQAVQLYEESMRRDKTDGKSRYNLGILLVSLGRHQEAVPVYNQLLELRGSDAGVHHGLGVALVGAGQYDQGVDSLVTAIKLNPENPSAYTVLARAHASSGDLPRAREAVQVALKLKPRFQEARLLQQDLMIRDGDFDAAIRECEKMLNQKQDGKVYYNLARAHVLAGDIDTGLKALRNAFQVDDSLRFQSKDDQSFETIRDNRRFRELQEGRLGLF